MFGLQPLISTELIERLRSLLVLRNEKRLTKQRACAHKIRELTVLQTTRRAQKD